MIGRWTMEDSDGTSKGGLGGADAARGDADRRERLDEMMAVALYPGGDGADDETLLRYAKEAAKGNPEYVAGTEAHGLEYDIAIGLAGDHAAGFLIDEVRALTGAADPRLPAVARVVMGAVSSMSCPDCAECPAPPEWLLSLLDRLAERIDPRGGGGTTGESMDEPDGGGTIRDGRGNETEASGADGAPERMCALGDHERRERHEALMDWRRDTERLIKAMRDALPPGHPLAVDADRWLDGCDYWIEDITGIDIRADAPTS
jgi:hypothetical protein